MYPEVTRFGVINKLIRSDYWSTFYKLVLIKMWFKMVTSILMHSSGLRTIELTDFLSISGCRHTVGYVFQL